MAKGFDATYVRTMVLGEMSDGRKVELGHYKENSTGKEYADKIYFTGNYTNKKGEEKEFINATQLTIKDLAELQKIDLSEFDTESNAPDFD